MTKRRMVAKKTVELPDGSVVEIEIATDGDGEVEVDWENAVLVEIEAADERVAAVASGAVAQGWTLGREAARESARAQGLLNGRKGGRPAKKRAAAEVWLRAHEAEVRQSKRTREGLATWVLAEMPKRNRPSRTVMLEALADLLGPR